MAKASDSKGKTLAAAARLFRQQGYHGTALHDILAAGGSPRGSLYFHFPKGKEEIGEAALTIAGEGVRQAIARAAEASESAEIFLVRIVRGMAADLEKSGYKEGCPIATTALETSAQSDVLGAATRTAFQKWENEIKRAVVLTSGDRIDLRDLSENIREEHVISPEGGGMKAGVRSTVLVTGQDPEPVGGVAGSLSA